MTQLKIGPSYNQQEVSAGDTVAFRSGGTAKIVSITTSTSQKLPVKLQFEGASKPSKYRANGAAYSEGASPHDIVTLVARGLNIDSLSAGSRLTWNGQTVFFVAKAQGTESAIISMTQAYTNGDQNVKLVPVSSLSRAN